MLRSDSGDMFLWCSSNDEARFRWGSLLYSSAFLFYLGFLFDDILGFSHTKAKKDKQDGAATLSVWMVKQAVRGNWK